MKAPAAGDDFRPPVGDQVQRGELLKEPHRVLGGQHRDGSAEPEVGGFPGDGGQHDFRGGEGEVPPVVLAQAQEAQPAWSASLASSMISLQPLLG